MSPSDAFLSEHEQVWQLLPWHVNGTLEPTESERVEEHLRHCLPCHAELDRQRETASLVQGPEDLPLSPRAGLARLEARLEASVRRRPPRRKPLGWAWVALAEAAVIVVLVGSAIVADRPPALPEPRYETLTDPSPVLERATGPLYRVLFAETASERDLRSLLADLHLRVVDGPTPLGLFTLELGAERKDTAAVLERLRSHDAVRFAERIDLRPDRPAGEAPPPPQ